MTTVAVVPFTLPGVPILVAAAVAAVWGWFSHDQTQQGLEPDIDPGKFADASDAREKE